MAIKYKVLSLLPLLLCLQGCPAMLGEVAAPTISAVGSYFSYQASQIEPVEVTTVSADCYLVEYEEVSCEERKTLKMTEEGWAVLLRTAERNKLLVDKCPNIEKPPELDCS